MNQFESLNLIWFWRKELKSDVSRVMNNVNIKTMGNYTNKLGERLADLMKKNYDAEKGFKKAAKNVELDKLKYYFIHKAQERHDFGDQLKSEIKHFVQNTNQSTVSKDSVFPTWIDIKSCFFEDDLSVLEETRKGEIISIEEYNDVLKNKALTYSIRELLNIQKHTIEHSLINIKRLEDL